MSAEGTDAGSSEARRNLPVPLRVSVSLPDGREAQEFAVNLSAGGICLHCTNALLDAIEAGEGPDRVHLRFEVPDGPVVSTAARVVWSSEREEPTRFREVGLGFEGLDADVLRALTAWAELPIDRRR